MKILKKTGLNSHADIDLFADISDQTVASYIKEMQCKQVKGKIQATSRVDPFNDIKNCMAKAAGMAAINELVDEQHFHSDDEIGLFLNGWGSDAGQPKLVVCEISNKWLKEHNISASRSEDPNQQRAVHIGTTQQPSTGELTCSCSYLGCRAVIDITTALLKKNNEGTWKKCKVKNCSTWTCPSHFDKLEEHEVICKK